VVPRVGRARARAAVLEHHEDKDGRSAGRKTDDGCIIVGAGVSAFDPKSMEKMMGDGKSKAGVP
jgi:hypothetical protein